MRLKLTSNTKNLKCLAWHDSIENLRLLAQHLQDKGDEIDTAEYLEKPWKWSPEWHEYMESVRG